MTHQPHARAHAAHPTDKWSDRDFISVWDARPTSALRREQMDIMAAVIKDNYRAGSRILSLGCGTGKLEELIFSRVPSARFTSVDRSAVMLELAAEKLARHRANVTFVQSDLARLARARLPGAPFRFITSVNVLHELPDPVKRRLFRFCRSNLTAGGLLLILDRLAIDRKRLHAAYASTLDRLQRITGEKSGELSRDFVDPRATDHEQPISLEQYLRWLRAARFEPAVLHLHFHKALIAARPVE